MAISISCPFCEKALHVSSTAAGRNVRCPDCNASVKIPDMGTGKFHLSASGRQKLVLTIASVVVFGIIIVAVMSRVFK